MNDRALFLLKAAGLGFFIAANILYFSPAQIYVHNADEFISTLSDIFTINLPGILILSAIVILVAMLVPTRSRVRYLALLSSISILFWIQGSLIVWDYGALNGARIPWLEMLNRGLIDTSMWLALLAACFFASHRYINIFPTISTTIFIIQCTVLIFNLTNVPEKITGVQQQNVSEVISNFSESKNILHIVMDGFQSDIFADIVHSPDNHSYRQSLKGFTAFPENLGLFPYTELSVPALVSGLSYENEIPLADFLSTTMGGVTVLSEALAAGYELDLAAMNSVLEIYGKSSHTNSLSLSAALSSSPLDVLLIDAARIIDLSLFRVTPHFVKALIYQDELWFIQRFMQTRKYLHLNYFADLQFLNELKETMTVTRKKPVYKLFHLMLSHRPTVGNEHCEFDGIRSNTRANVMLQARCGLISIISVFDRMKELGIYDNTIIILMADHGAWVPPKESIYTNLPASEAPSPTIVGLALPTLAIKPVGAKGDLQFSSSLTSIADVSHTIAKLAGFDTQLPGLNVFELSNENRLRRFYSYAYGGNRHHKGFVNPLQEYRVTGSAYDPRNWSRADLHQPVVSHQ